MPIQSISAIVAMTQDFGIGNKGDLPWPRIPEDMKHFASLTAGRPVIMGRKTWESIPEKFRPLKGRWNIIITSQHDYDTGEVPEGALVTTVPSLEMALTVIGESKKDQHPVIIGGGSIYAQAYSRIEHLYVTWVSGSFECDVFFPRLFEGDWEKVEERPLTPSARMCHLHRRKQSSTV